MIYSTSKKLFILIAFMLMVIYGADNPTSNKWCALDSTNTVLLTLKVPNQ